MLLVLMLFGLLQAPPPAFFMSTIPVEEMRNKQAVFETTYGTIVMDLLPDAAPTPRAATRPSTASS